MNNHGLMLFRIIPTFDGKMGACANGSGTPRPDPLGQPLSQKPVFNNLGSSGNITDYALLSDRLVFFPRLLNIIR